MTKAARHRKPKHVEESTASATIAAGPRRSRASRLLEAMRPHQWSKNLLIFVPQLLAHHIFDGRDWGRSALAFACFCLCASSVYLINDAIDIESDRAHPKKRHRPFASGDVPVRFAYQLAPTLLLLAFVPATLFLKTKFVAALALYLAVATLYSAALNRYPILDILVLATLYALRLLAGSMAVSVAASPWLLGFSTFFFLSLGFLKRYVELINLRDSNQLHKNRAGYRTEDLVLLLSGGMACGYLSVLIFALYLNAPDTSHLYRHPMVLWAICPVLMYWLSRAWLTAHRGAMHYDPVEYALRDVVSLCLGGACVAIVGLGVLL